MSTSLDIFNLQAKRCRKHLKDSWDSASGMCHLFRQEEDIWPNQCNCVRNSLLTLSNPQQSFYGLMNTDGLPIEVVPFRYSLIIPLHRIDTLVDELTFLISAFRVVCRTSTRDAMIRRLEIQRKLDELEQGIEDILQNVDRMLIQVRAQEKATTPETQPVA